jgi:hypothetical protein
MPDDVNLHLDGVALLVESDDPVVRWVFEEWTRNPEPQRHEE